MYGRVVALCLTVSPLLAQTPGDTKPTFQSGTTLVQVTAIVRDAQGNSPAGLTAEDFQIFDGGKRQTISSFERKRHEQVDATQTTRPVLPSGLTTTGVRPSRFVAFLVDDQNLVPEQFPQAVRAALRNVEELQPGDRVAIVSTSGRMVVPFTSDREKLRKALSGMGSLGRRATFDVSSLVSEITCKITYLKADWISRGDPGSMQNCVRPVSRPSIGPPAPLRPGAGGGLTLGPLDEHHQIQLENQVRAFADSIVQAGDRDLQAYFLGLARLITHMSHMPGERLIITLSPGMYVPPRFYALQNQTIENAVRAQVVVSGVDPRGVYIHDDPDDPSTSSDTWGIAESRERVTFMENLTSGTGGTNIRGNNDIAGAITRLRSTPETYYLLSFSPSQVKLDGKFHPLRVALTRRHGLTVQARSGYYATASGPDPLTLRERQIQEAFFSSEERHEIPVTLQIRSSQLPGVSAVLTAAAQIDLRNLPFRRDGAINRNNLTLLVGLFDENGNLVNDIWKEITLHPDDASLDAVRRAGIEVKTEFDVEPGRYMVRAMVRDDQAQSIGTRSVPVIIRP